MTSPGFLAMTRARHWAHFLALPGASACFDGSVGASLGLARGVLIAALVLSFGYMINAVSDRRMDLDDGKNPFVAAPAPPRGVRLTLWALAVGALAVAGTAPRVVTCATVVCLLSGVVYSTGPRLKAVPFAGTVLNVTNFAPLLFVGAASSALPPGVTALAALFSLLLLQNQLLHEGGDVEEDRRGALRTTFLVARPRQMAGLVLALGVAASAAFRSIAAASGLALSAACAACFALLFPVAVLAWGEEPPRMKEWRAVHRYASAAFGALAFFLARAHGAP